MARKTINVQVTRVDHWVIGYDDEKVKLDGLCNVVQNASRQNKASILEGALTARLLSSEYPCEIISKNGGND